jgi:hypothetical protein
VPAATAAADVIHAHVSGTKREVGHLETRQPRRLEVVREGWRAGEPWHRIGGPVGYGLSGQVPIGGSAHLGDDRVGPLRVAHAVDADDLGTGIAQSSGAFGSGEAIIGRGGRPEGHGDQPRLP